MNISKGNKLYLFGNWDRKGTFYYEPVTVHSAGKKIIRLMRENGNLIGSEFSREHEGVTFHFLSIECENPEAYILPFAERFLEREKARLESCIARNSDKPVYIKAIQSEIAALHEPRVERHNFP